MSKKLKQHRWSCSGFDPLALAEIIGENHQLEQGPLEPRKIELYDSFDRPFTNSGQSLVRLDGVFSIVDDDLTRPKATAGRKIRHRRPVFWWDFEPGAFQDQLRSRLKLRAALPLASANLEETRFDVRDGDGKIVLRLGIHSLFSGDKVLAQELIASPLVGYEDQAAGICRSISKSPILSDEPKTLIQSLHELVEDPGALPSRKSPIPIRPDECLQSAVTRIAATMLEVARHSEAGIIDDIDTEYLHDYRVAIRKLRSVIALVEGAYPDEETRRLKSEFGDHARATNRLRDLDVYLLRESAYRNRIPENLRPGLDRMFTDFRKERGRVIEKLRRRLRSKRYLDAMKRRADWFNKESLPAGRRAEQAIGKVVIKEIRKHYRHVRKLGSALTNATADRDIHKLRIECKRLRYLLELFASLFKQKSLKKILRRLKGLQDVLGDFNDFSMQSVAMKTYLDEASKLDKHSSAAVGALITVLYGEQSRARAGVAERFREFSDGKMRQQFKTLFAELQTPKR